MDFNHSLENSKDYTVSVYTAFCILKGIRRQIGLEAMLDYIDSHIEIVNRVNPRAELAVEEALTRVKLEKIYKDATQWGREKDSPPL